MFETIECDLVVTRPSSLLLEIDMITKKISNKILISSKAAEFFLKSSEVIVVSNENIFLSPNDFKKTVYQSDNTGLGFVQKAFGVL